ncbi:hypothetical protein M5K25_016508 [Dendrobium thyrsiflorum]|uniref:Secreted protein n=1 Tax=Dendrobium thyrsiflorum TaxID=117978 RepID=A0ABD0UJT9_DENTH
MELPGAFGRKKAYMDLRPFFLALVLFSAATGKLCCTAREFHSRFSGWDDSTSGRRRATPPPPQPIVDYHRSHFYPFHPSSPSGRPFAVP